MSQERNLNLLIRADAGGDLGTGHVMRMIALGQAWQDGGGRVVFACAACPSMMVARLESEGFEFKTRDIEPGSTEDLQWVIELAVSRTADWVVLDGYHFKEGFQQKLRDQGIRVMAVDDCGHCETWPAHAVLNVNLHAGKDTVAGAAHAHDTSFLLGPRFALLRREFQTLPSPNPPDPDGRLRILVTFGGVDPTGAALSVVHNLASVAGSFRFRVRALVGTANPRAEEFANLALSHTDWLVVKETSHDMPAEYAWADRIISAGGGTCLEWLRFRKPGWVLSIADNQIPVVNAIRDQNLAATGGNIQDYPDASLLAQPLMDWLRSEPPSPPPIVDPWGASRVAAWLDGSRLIARPVDASNAEDIQYLFELANEPSVRNAGFHTDPIPWQTHVEWLQRHSESADSLLLCVEHHEFGRCAFVRFHRRSEQDWEIGIAVSPAVRGRGIARAAVNLGIRHLHRADPERHVMAVIRTNNQASMTLFQSMGFLMDGHQNTESSMTLKYP